MSADTVYALSSGPPPSAIAVVRISGPQAFAAAEQLAGTRPAPRRASLRRILAADGSLIDRAVVLVFPGPGSATGEDIVEFHLHGGRAVVRAVEAALSAVPGLRPAEAGEFTRRALLNGRIDLTEAEGLADLLAAETESQRRAAVAAAEGGLRRRIAGWTTRVVAMAAMIEATIDHDDEDDVGDAGEIVARVRRKASMLADEILHIVDQPPVERLRDGIRVVLAGPRNSGKSTLFNALVEREAAIVSPIAGTTRDRIEAPVVRNGIAWVFIDTAGLVDETDDPIETIGIDRSRESMKMADVVLWLGDDPAPLLPAATIALHARADLPGRSSIPAGRIAARAMIANGLTELWAALDTLAVDTLPSVDLPSLNRRQAGLCRSAADVLTQIECTEDSLVVAHLLVETRNVFDRLTGAASVEHVLDALFEGFCIGK